VVVAPVVLVSPPVTVPSPVDVALSEVEEAPPLLADEAVVLVPSGVLVDWVAEVTPLPPPSEPPPQAAVPKTSPTSEDNPTKPPATRCRNPSIGLVFSRTSGAGNSFGRGVHPGGAGVGVTLISDGWSQTAHPG
jgi:hypothetical protein